MLLAGDIGGTKTNLAIYSLDGSLETPLAEKTFPSGRYPNLESLVQEFLSEANLEVDRAAFGVAGPVVGGRVTTTTCHGRSRRGSCDGC
jgi:glucokinase